MKKIFALCIALMTIGAASAQNYNLKAGQPIPVRIITSVSSDNRLQLTALQQRLLMVRQYI